MQDMKGRGVAQSAFRRCSNAREGVGAPRAAPSIGTDCLRAGHPRRQGGRGGRVAEPPLFGRIGRVVLGRSGAVDGTRGPPRITADLRRQKHARLEQAAPSRSQASAGHGQGCAGGAPGLAKGAAEAVTGGWAGGWDGDGRRESRWGGGGAEATWHGCMSHQRGKKGGGYLALFKRRPGHGTPCTWQST